MPEILAADQYPEWDEFVGTAKGGTVFHTAIFLRPWCDNLRIQVIRDSDGRIECGQAITPAWFLLTRSTRRPRWTPYNGPLIRPSEKANPCERNSEEKDRLLRILADSPKFGMYDYIFPPEYADLIPLLWNGFEVSVSYTYQIEPMSSEQLVAGMSRNNWKNLRNARNKAKELGATVRLSTDADEFYGMMCDLADYDGIGMCSRPTFLAWWESLSKADAGAIYVCYDGKGHPLVGNLTVWDSHCLYIIVAGVRGGRLEGPAGYAHRIVLEHLIQEAHAKGLTFDFEGSVLPGIEPYFRGWGGRLVPNYRAIKIHSPWTYAAWVLHRYWTRHRKKQRFPG